MTRRHSVIPLLLILAGTATHAQAPVDLATLGLEELMQLRVTSVSRHEQSLFTTPAAVYVITKQEIRRSGLRTLPELLRLVPGLHVARGDGTKWAISARGFNTQFTNKMLVIIDGRSAYNRLFSGVYWEIWDMALDEIERVEVIRGPGASIWGDNAVNGVINIVTRSAFDALGGRINLGTGSQDRGTLDARYAGELGDDTAYRLFAKTVASRGQYLGVNRSEDDSRRVTFGGRLDGRRSGSQQFMIEASHRVADARQIERVFSFRSGAGLEVEDLLTTSSTAQGRWTAPMAGGELQAFGAFEHFSHTHHAFGYGYDVTNAEVQYHATSRHHEFITGAGYRFTDDYVQASERLSLTPPSVAQGMFSLFAQDEVRWAGGRGRVILGSRVGRTEFTGWGWQPTARVLWQLTPTQNVWTAASRALRTPSRGDRGFRLNLATLPGPGTPRVVATLGQPEFRDEQLHGFETGYRAAPTSGLTVDVVAYLNHYSDLLSVEPGAAFAASSPIPHLVLPRYRSNMLAARTAGIEFSTVWTPIAPWRLEGTYARFHIDPMPAAGSVDPNGPGYDGNTPRHQGSVRSRLSLGPAVDFDVNLFAVGRLRQLNIPAYNRLDTRLAWRVQSGLELALTGQDLLRPRHFEFGGLDTESNVTEVPRTVAIEATWQF